MTDEQSKLADCTDLEISNEWERRFGVTLDPAKCAPSPDTRVREALQKCSGALGTFPERLKIAFTGEWSHLGAATIGEIIDDANAALTALTQPGAVETDDWNDDPSSDERWSVGVHCVMKLLCEYLGVDPDDVTWDAATETVDGDISAVIGNILRAKFGEDWGPSDGAIYAAVSQSGISETERADLMRDVDAKLSILALDPATVEACARKADAVQYRMRDECDFGAGMAAKEIRALIGQPARNAGHLVSSTDSTSDSKFGTCTDCGQFPPCVEDCPNFIPHTDGAKS